MVRNTLLPNRRAKTVVTDEQRANYIETAAHFIAERRGFTLGNDMDDWLAAEAEVAVLIKEGKLGG